MTRTEQLVTALVLVVNLGVGATLVARSDYTNLVSRAEPTAVASVSPLAPENGVTVSHSPFDE